MSARAIEDSTGSVDRGAEDGGHCTVRSIVAVLEHGLGIHVSVGYVQGIITQASTNARPALQRLREAVTLSRVISIDEVFFKEMAKEMARKILGYNLIIRFVSGDQKSR